MRSFKDASAVDIDDNTARRHDADLTVYRNYFKSQYITDINWDYGDSVNYTIPGPESPVVITGLQVDDTYTVMTADRHVTGLIEIIDTKTGTTL